MRERLILLAVWSGAFALLWAALCRLGSLEGPAGYLLFVLADLAVVGLVSLLFLLVVHVPQGLAAIVGPLRPVHDLWTDVVVLNELTALPQGWHFKHWNHRVLAYMPRLQQFRGQASAISSDAHWVSITVLGDYETSPAQLLAQYRAQFLGEQSELPGYSAPGFRDHVLDKLVRHVAEHTFRHASQEALREVAHNVRNDVRYGHQRKCVNLMLSSVQGRGAVVPAQQPCPA